MLYWLHWYTIESFCNNGYLDRSRLSADRSAVHGLFCVREYLNIHQIDRDTVLPLLHWNCCNVSSVSHNLWISLNWCKPCNNLTATDTKRCRCQWMKDEPAKSTWGLHFNKQPTVSTPAHSLELLTITMQTWLETTVVFHTSNQSVDFRNVARMWTILRYRWCC